MSEPIPESVPTSADPRSHRPLKRRQLTPSSAQATHLDALFAKPDIPITLPTDSTKKNRPNVPPPPEIVANVQGSSAGAGSGEFHVYKASRRREYERLRQMDEEVSREKADEEYERKKEEMRKRDEEKTSKNKKRREKMKARKGGKKGGKGDVEMGDEQEQEKGSASGVNGNAVKKLGHVKLGPRNGADDGDDEKQEQVVAKSVEDVGLVIYDDD